MVMGCRYSAYLSGWYLIVCILTPDERNCSGLTRRSHGEAEALTMRRVNPLGSALVRKGKRRMAAENQAGEYRAQCDPFTHDFVTGLAVPRASLVRSCTAYGKIAVPCCATATFRIQDVYASNSTPSRPRA